MHSINNALLRRSPAQNGQENIFSQQYDIPRQDGEPFTTPMANLSQSSTKQTLDLRSGAVLVGPSVDLGMLS